TGLRLLHREKHANSVQLRIKRQGIRPQKTLVQILFRSPVDDQGVRLLIDAQDGGQDARLLVWYLQVDQGTAFFQQAQDGTDFQWGSNLEVGIMKAHGALTEQ